MTEFVLPKHQYYHQQHEIHDWCVEHFGIRRGPNYRWFIRFAFGDQFVMFAREKDASLFALKWL